MVWLQLSFANGTLDRLFSYSDWSRGRGLTGKRSDKIGPPHKNQAVNGKKKEMIEAMIDLINMISIINIALLSRGAARRI